MELALIILKTNKNLDKETTSQLIKSCLIS